jgi:DNA-directed RNA polymerase subunit RPC12/RpoP
MASPQDGEVRALQCPRCGAALPPAADAFVVCQYCGSSLVWKPSPAGAAAEQTTAVRGMCLKQFAYTDTQGTGLEMFRMLAPAGWQFQGGCRWLLDNPGMPAVVSLSLGNPQGAEAFEIMPNLNFIWNNHPMARLTAPVGSHHFGAEVRPPMKVLEAFHQIVLPRYRGSVRDLQVSHEELVPELPRIVKSEAAVSGGWAEGGKLRIHYAGIGGPLEEEIYGMVEVYPAPQVLLWWLNYLFSFRTADGRLDATADLFSVMIHSFRINPEWQAALKAIIQYLIKNQIQRIRHVGEIGEIYARTGREIREQNLNGWYARQAVYDRIATDRSRQIRDVDAFFDPHREELVELPSGYGHAWANDLGEYILTDQADFNPNLESNQHWEPMEQK